MECQAGSHPRTARRLPGGHSGARSGPTPADRDFVAGYQTPFRYYGRTPASWTANAFSAHSSKTHAGCPPGLRDRARAPGVRLSPTMGSGLPTRNCTRTKRTNPGRAFTSLASNWARPSAGIACGWSLRGRIIGSMWRAGTSKCEGMLAIGGRTRSQAAPMRSVAWALGADPGRDLLGDDLPTPIPPYPPHSVGRVSVGCDLTAVLAPYPHLGLPSVSMEAGVSLPP